MNHHELTRFRSLAHTLAIATLAGSGVDADTRAALDAVARAALAGPTQRGAPAPGPGALHLRTVNVRAVREDAREVDYVASTESVDSHDEILRQNWIFTRYERNPVILWSHNNDWAVPGLPIGRAAKFGVVDKQLLITPKFSEKNPFARIVFDMIVEDMLRAGSVGFRPHKVSRETIDGVERVICDQNELYEFSICPMGSNADALVLSAEERMVKMIDERSKSAVLSFPTKGGSVDVEALAANLNRLALAQRANNTPVRAGTKDIKTMKTKKLSAEDVTDLVSRGILTHECDDCKAVTVIDAPSLVKVAGEGASAVALAATNAERAKAADAARAEAETRAKAAEDRAKALDAERAAAIAERDAAKTLAGTEKKRADDALSAKAEIELAPLVGVAPWQLTPAAAKRLATRAVTDPEGYAADVAETTAKGVAAGGIKSSVQPRVPATSLPDPTPATSERDADPNAVGADLNAELNKRAREHQGLTAANAVASAVT